MDTGLLIIRLVVGVVMVFHGTQKLAGWWGGEGLRGAADFFARQGYRPPLVMAAVAATIETVAGALLILGLLSPASCVLLIASLTNVLVLHARNGLDRRRGGFEYELVLLASVACVAFAGPGTLSLDSAFGVDLFALAATVSNVSIVGVAAGTIIVAIGVLGGLLIVSTRKRQPIPLTTT